MSKLLLGLALTFVAPAKASSALGDLTPHAEYTDSTRIESIDGVLSASVAQGSEVFCETAYERGTAAHLYSNFTQTDGVFEPPDVSQFVKQSILAFECSVRDIETHENLNFRDPPLLFDSFNTPGKILLTFTGNCLSDYVVFKNSSITNIGTYNGTQQYAANVSSAIVHSCIQPHDSTTTVIAQLSLQARVVSNFISDAVFSVPLLFSETTDWKTFTVTDRTLLFDLGTQKPHFSYYEALESCQSQLCKGSLILQSGFAKTTLITDLMNSTLMYRAVRDEFKSCFNPVIVHEERMYSNQEACYGKYALLHDAVHEIDGNFLDPLECPFDEEEVISSPANLQACFQKESLFDNSCAASVARVGDPSLLGNIFTQTLTDTPAVNRAFNYTFIDTLTGSKKRFQSVSLMNASLDTVYLEPDQLYFDLHLNLSGASVAEQIKAVDPITGWTKSVTLGAQMVITEIPRQVKHIDITGKLRTGCEFEETSLLNSGVLPISFETAGVTSGRFVQVDPCTDFFLYYRDVYQQQDLTIVGAAGDPRLQNAQVRVCGVNTTDCESSTDAVVPSGSSSDIWVHIQNVCHYEEDLGLDSNGVMLKDIVYVAQGESLGYVLMNQAAATTAHAPVICAGFCRDHVVRLPDLTLDWTIEFQANTTDLKLVADQDRAMFNDFKFNASGKRNFKLNKLAYLADPEQPGCMPGGTSVGYTDACLVYSDTSDDYGNFIEGTAQTFSTASNAFEMMDLLKLCGSPVEIGSALLIQQFEVDYGTFSPDGAQEKENFCHSSLVSVIIDKKIVGLTSSTLLVSEVINEASSNQIGVSIGNVEYEECVGGYKLVSTANLHHNIVGETWTIDDTGSDFVAALVPGFQALEWSTECRDVCGTESGFLSNWTNSTSNLYASVEAGDSKAVVEFEVQMSGSPCAVEQNFDGSGEVLLELYVAEGNSCSNSDTRTNQSPHADQALCAHIKFEHNEDYELKITDSMVTRKHSSGLAQVLCEEIGDPVCTGDPRGLLFQAGTTLNASHNEATSSGMFHLDQSDSFANLTYVIFWEQNYMGISRRLRSTHIFGESMLTSHSSLTILPTSAQMGDLSSEIHFDQSGVAYLTTPSVSTSSTANGNWGLIGGIAGVCLLLGGLYMYRKPNKSVKQNKNKKNGYKKVQEYEPYESLTTDF